MDGIGGMSVHGTARFATRNELERAKLLRSWSPEATGQAHARLAVRKPLDFAPSSYQGDLHQLIVGGSGGGKFTTAIAPMLLGRRVRYTVEWEMVMAALIIACIPMVLLFLGLHQHLARGIKTIAD